MAEKDEIKDFKRISSEYSEECAHYEDEYRIRVRSEVIELVKDEPEEEDRGSYIPDAAPLPTQKKLKRNRQVMDVTALAVLRRTEEGRLEFRYEDTLSPDDPPVETHLSFDPALPGLVTVERCGALVTSTLIFEEGQSYRNEYRTPFVRFDLTVRSRKVVNGLTEDGGHMHLDYDTQYRGAVLQRVKMDIEIVRI